MKSHDPKYLRTLEKREARARRSQKMGRVLFGLLGICVMLTIRMNPALATEIATYITQHSAEQARTLPGVQPVAQMPISTVKVRKGTGFGTQPATNDSQAMAQDLGQMLSQMKVGQ
jgi:hypothetical protein